MGIIRKKVVIIGAGLTGLSCGYRLNKKIDFLILEKNLNSGGICSTIEKDGFLFDYSGHLLHLRWDDTRKLVLKLLSNNIVKIKRNAQIYIQKTFVNYPFQINLYNLPANIKHQCVCDFLIAYSKYKDTQASSSFKEWALKTFGRSICRYFMFPYNEKLFSYSPDILTTDWIGSFVPQPDLYSVIKGAYEKNIDEIGYNHNFYYPEYGGIGYLSKKFEEEIKNISKGEEVNFIDFNKKVVFLKNGNKINYSKLINTIPLKKFILISNAPDNVKNAAKKLKHNTLYILNIGIKKTNFKQHWIYFPEKKFPFYRLGFYTNFSLKLAPSGYDSIYIEISVKEGDYLDLKEIQKVILKSLKEIGIIQTPDDIITALWTKIDCAYVIYDFEREKSLKIIFDYLNSIGVVSTGRYGGWKYSFMEENIKDGFETADKILREVI